MRNYKCLNQNRFHIGNYKLVPLRYGDRINIMKWRNDQIHHLRQREKLTIQQQNKYFEEVVSSLFKKQFPDQILFSLLENDVFVGYGGLVHINWHDKNAEVSFLCDSNSNKKEFEQRWITFINFLQNVAFDQLNFIKIYTYAFDVREYLYPILTKLNFSFEARLKNHCIVENLVKDVIIHSKFKKDDFEKSYN